jgi:hypothetical protein
MRLGGAVTSRTRADSDRKAAVAARWTRNPGEATRRLYRARGRDRHPSPSPGADSEQGSARPEPQSVTVTAVKNDSADDSEEDFSKLEG